MRTFLHAAMCRLVLSGENKVVGGLGLPVLLELSNRGVGGTHDAPGVVQRAQVCVSRPGFQHSLGRDSWQSYLAYRTLSFLI